MPEWLAVVLIIALVAFAVWVLFAVIFSALYSDVGEGVSAATGVVVVLGFVCGLIAFYVWLGNLILGAVG